MIWIIIFPKVVISFRFSILFSWFHTYAVMIVAHTFYTFFDNNISKKKNHAKSWNFPFCFHFHKVLLKFVMTPGTSLNSSIHSKLKFSKTSQINHWHTYYEPNSNFGKKINRTHNFYSTLTKVTPPVFDKWLFEEEKQLRLCTSGWLKIQFILYTYEATRLH